MHVELINLDTGLPEVKHMRYCTSLSGITVAPYPTMSYHASAAGSRNEMMRGRLHRAALLIAAAAAAVSICSSDAAENGIRRREKRCEFKKEQTGPALMCVLGCVTCHSASRASKPRLMQDSLRHLDFLNLVDCPISRHREDEEALFKRSQVR